MDHSQQATPRQLVPFLDPRITTIPPAALTPAQLATYMVTCLLALHLRHQAFTPKHSSLPQFLRRTRAQASPTHKPRPCTQPSHTHTPFPHWPVNTSPRTTYQQHTTHKSQVQTSHKPTPPPPPAAVGPAKLFQTPKTRSSIPHSHARAPRLPSQHCTQCRRIPPSTRSSCLRLASLYVARGIFRAICSPVLISPRARPRYKGLRKQARMKKAKWRRMHEWSLAHLTPGPTEERTRYTTARSSSVPSLD